MAHSCVRRRVLLIATCLLAVLVGLAALAGVSRAQGDGAIQLRKVVDNLASPVFVTHAGDGSGRLFVVEQNGAIRIVKNGVLAPQPFLDIHRPRRAGRGRGRPAQRSLPTRLSAIWLLLRLLQPQESDPCAASAG